MYDNVYTRPGYLQDISIMPGVTVWYQYIIRIPLSYAFDRGSIFFGIIAATDGYNI